MDTEQILRYIPMTTYLYEEINKNYDAMPENMQIMVDRIAWQAYSEAFNKITANYPNLERGRDIPGGVRIPEELWKRQFGEMEEYGKRIESVAGKFYFDRRYGSGY